MNVFVVSDEGSRGADRGGRTVVVGPRAAGEGDDWRQLSGQVYRIGVATQSQMPNLGRQWRTYNDNGRSYRWSDY
ncbi:hypothetical protein GWI33_023235 [Rhynchophorus ferrugineus]|uniref:Uncharacterized protein n=1 Tax=Rhynchophorus ferrugineus TaxID=354439 RepID=A0A834MKL4_RHYFE|nr:hypothetical protein GWI33_023235 [Rhynchophorus ferrugineus]